MQAYYRQIITMSKEKKLLKLKEVKLLQSLKIIAWKKKDKNPWLKKKLKYRYYLHKKNQF
jgi:hypothetical protein